MHWCLETSMITTGLVGRGGMTEVKKICKFLKLNGQQLSEDRVE